MRANAGLDIETAISVLDVGEALVSFLDEKGRPSVTESVIVLPPGRQIGPITPEQRKALIAGYTLIQVRSRDEALEWARRYPNPVGEGMAAEIEVRRLYEETDFASVMEGAASCSKAA